jgi:hypothetical protein
MHQELIGRTSNWSNESTSLSYSIESDTVL